MAHSGESGLRWPLDQARGGGYAQHRLGKKGVGQPGPRMRRAANATPECRHQFFDARLFQHMGNPLQLRRQGPISAPNPGSTSY